MTEQKTICTACLRLRQGYCDGEKELTACPSYKQMTNGDRIRAMTDEELANIVCCQNAKSGDECFDASCYECTLDWLKQEVEE